MLQRVLLFFVQIFFPVNLIILSCVCSHRDAAGAAASNTYDTSLVALHSYLGGKRLRVNYLVPLHLFEFHTFSPTYA